MHAKVIDYVYVLGTPGEMISKLLCKLSSSSKLGAMQSVSLCLRSNRELGDGENACRVSSKFMLI